VAVRRPAPPKAVFNPAKLAAIASKCGIADIQRFVVRVSPICPDYTRAAEFLAHLYYAGEKVVLFTRFKSQGQSIWERDLHPGQPMLERGPDGVWFLANPVDGDFHPNPRQDGKPSRRSEESVTNFRFAVLESDETEAIEWLKLLVQFPLEISAIYSSGGRSIHALIRVDAINKVDWDEAIVPVKGWLTQLGADPAALTAVRLSRLPQMYRGDRRQELLYLDPNPDGVPICHKALRPAYKSWLQWAQAVLIWGGAVDETSVRACLEQLHPFRSEPAVEDILIRLASLIREGVK